MPLFGPPNIEKSKAKGDVSGLIRALRYRKDFQVREGAAQALGEIGDPRSVGPLIDTLRDEQLTVRWSAADALAKIGDARAVEPLIAAFKDKLLRNVKALGQINDTRAVEPLCAALEDKSHEVRHAAAKGLGKIGDPRAVGPLISALSRTPDMPTMEALGRIGDARAVEPLVPVLKDKSPYMRETAARTLGLIGDARAVEPLLTTLTDENDAVREAALGALNNIEWQPDQSEEAAAYWIAARQWDRCADLGAPAVEPLLAALKDKDEQVREGAAGALGRIGHPSVVEPLLAALSDKSSTVRRAVAEGLVSMYRSGKLNDTATHAILAQRDTISMRHYDRRPHHDKRWCDGAFHEDSRQHRDLAAVKFPL
jgi:HEAT repeat protein